jgi:hypothetical protein
MSGRTRIYLSESMYARNAVGPALATPQPRISVSHWRLFKRRVSSLFKKTRGPYDDKFAHLPEIKVEFDMKPTETCPICLEDYIYTQRIKILPCLHYYHKHCIREWLCERGNSCPMCRIPV